MVTITNGTRVTKVTAGVFHEVYEPYGWEICDTSKENAPDEEVVENNEKKAEATKEPVEETTEEETPEPEEEPVEEEEVEIPLSEMKLDELKAYAAKHDIDITAAKTKKDIIDIIKAEMEA